MIGFLKKYRLYSFNILLFIYCIILIILASLPGNSSANSNHLDKLYHMVAYSLLSFILYFTLSFQNKVLVLKKYPVAFTILIATLFGMFNELFQIFIPTRSFNNFDLLANLVGIVSTAIIIKFSLIINKYYKSIL